MSIENKAGTSIIAGFKLLAKRPLDVREVVDTIDERDALATSNVVFAGLRVFVKATKSTYTYNGSSWDLMTIGEPYVHPSGDGNLHVPATGVNHGGDFLVAGKTAGSAYWKTVVPSDIGASAEGHVHVKADITDLVIPAKLPNPNAITFATLNSDNSVKQQSYDGSSALSLVLTPNGIGAAPTIHTHTKAEITDFPEAMKTVNPLKVYLGSNTATPESFNGEREVTLVISPDAIGAAAKNHTHSANNISGLPDTAPNPEALLISLNGAAQQSYTGSSRVAINITPSSIGASASDHTHLYAGSKTVGGSADSVANTLKISLNSGTTENSNMFTYNGAAEKIINITPSSIGASASDHTHLYAGSSSAGGAATTVDVPVGTVLLSISSSVSFFNNCFGGTWEVTGNITASIGDTGSTITLYLFKKISN